MGFLYLNDRVGRSAILSSVFDTPNQTVTDSEEALKKEVIFMRKLWIDHLDGSYTRGINPFAFSNPRMFREPIIYS